jgi:hypothetical protein
MHFDRNGCHNINAQVRGRKLFILFPPAEFAKLYPPTSSHAQRGDTGGRRGLGLLRNMSQIDLRTIHEPQQRARFPDFAGARGLKVVLHEGEMLIIPACWSLPLARARVAYAVLMERAPRSLLSRTFGS